MTISLRDLVTNPATGRLSTSDTIVFLAFWSVPSCWSGSPSPVPKHTESCISPIWAHGWHRAGHQNTCPSNEPERCAMWEAALKILKVSWKPLLVVVVLTGCGIWFGTFITGNRLDAQALAFSKEKQSLTDGFREKRTAVGSGAAQCCESICY